MWNAVVYVRSVGELKLDWDASVRIFLEAGILLCAFLNDYSCVSYLINRMYSDECCTWTGTCESMM